LEFNEDEDSREPLSLAERLKLKGANTDTINALSSEKPSKPAKQPKGMPRYEAGNIQGNKASFLFIYPFSSITSQRPQHSLIMDLELSKIDQNYGFCSLSQFSFALGEYVGGHNISTKFYNQPNPPGTPEIWPLNCPK